MFAHTSRLISIRFANDWVKRHIATITCLHCIDAGSDRCRCRVYQSYLRLLFYSFKTCLDRYYTTRDLLVQCAYCFTILLLTLTQPHHPWHGWLSVGRHHYELCTLVINYHTRILFGRYVQH